MRHYSALSLPFRFEMYLCFIDQTEYALHVILVRFEIFARASCPHL